MAVLSSDLGWVLLFCLVECVLVGSLHALAHLCVCGVCIFAHTHVLQYERSIWYLPLLLSLSYNEVGSII